MQKSTGTVPARQPTIFRRPSPRPRHVFDYALSSIRYGEWPQPITESDTVAVVRAVLADSERAVDEHESFTP